MAHTYVTIGSTSIKKALFNLYGTLFGDMITFVQPPVPAEVVVAGAASTLGKIGTVADGATVYVRCPCSDGADGAATARVKWRVSANKSHTVTEYLGRTTGYSQTLTLSTVLAAATVIINGLTFTAHATTTTAANREFSISGDNTADAAALAGLINDATYGVPGVVATPAAAVITLTATTATCLQSIPSAGSIVVSDAATLLALELGATHTGLATNATCKGKHYDQYVDGYPDAFLEITNNDGSAGALTLVVGATTLAV